MGRCEILTFILVLHSSWIHWLVTLREATCYISEIWCLGVYCYHLIGAYRCRLLVAFRCCFKRSSRRLSRMAKNLDVNVEALPVELMWEVQAYLSTKDLKVLGAADSRWGAGCPYSANI